MVRGGYGRAAPLRCGCACTDTHGRLATLTARGVLAGGWIAAASLFAAPAARADQVEVCLHAAEGAQDSRAEGKLRRAREQLLTCVDERCPAQVRGDCRAWLDDLDKRLPHVTIAVVDPEGADVLGADVRIDGEGVSYESGRPIALDPSTHEVVVSHAGFEPSRSSVVVRDGESSRVLRIALRRHVEVTTSRSPLPWILIGVGAASLVTSGILAGVNKSKFDSLDGSCAPSCSSSDVDALRTRALVVDVTLVVGLVTGGIGAYLALTQSSKEAR